MGPVYRIVRVHQQGDVVFHLLFVCCLELLIGSEAFHVSRMYAGFLALIHTVVEDHLQRTYHVKESSIVPSVLSAGYVRLHASYDAVVPCFLQRYTPVLHGGYYYLVVVVSRESYTRSRHFRCPHQKLLRRAVPYSYGYGRLREEYVLRRIQAHEGQIVGGIPSVGCLSAHYQILEE